MHKKAEDEAMEQLFKAMQPPAPITEAERQAIRRLVEVAKGDTGGSRDCAQFLLAWRDFGVHGGFDPRILWSLDFKLKADVLAILTMLSRHAVYPDDESFGDEFSEVIQRDFEIIIKRWAKP